MAILFAPKMMAQSSRPNPMPGLFPKTAVNPVSTVSLLQIKQGMSGLPLVFEPNLGQTDAQVRYFARAQEMISFV
jgi:hypothetical protein